MEDVNLDVFSKGIGNKEGNKALVAKPVVVQGKVIEPIKYKADNPDPKKAGKEIGKKLVLLCKHPDREELVRISGMKIIAGKTVKETTIWVKLDEDGMIEKGSHMALLLDKYGCKTLNELDGKTLLTEPDEVGYLIIKCY